MSVIFNILQSFLVTFAVTAVIGWLPLVFKPVRKGNPKGIASLYITAIIIGFYAGFAFIQQHMWPGFPPLDSGHWFIFFLIPIWLLSQWKIWKAPVYLSLVISRVLLISLMTHLILTPLRSSDLSLGHSLMIALGVGGVYALYTHGLDYLASESPASLYPPIFGLMSVSSAILFLFGSSAILNQQMLLVAITLAIPVVLFFWNTELKASQGLIGLYCFLLTVHWLNAWFFASLDPWSTLSLLAPLSLILLKIPALSKCSRELQYVMVWGVSALYLGLIVLLVFLNQPTEAFPY